MQTLAQLTVREAMHPGVLTCPPETPVLEVARMMATHGVHAVVVSGIARTPQGERLAWGVLSDMDLVRAVVAGDLDEDAGRLMGTEPVTVRAHEPLEAAASAMAEHDVSHLVVLDGAGEPVGVVSTMDVAASVAG